MGLYALLIAGSVFGVVVGALGATLGARGRFAALVLSGVLVFAYLSYVLAAGVWAARCWDCAVTGDDARSFLFVAGTFFYGLLVAIIIAAMWATVAVAGLLRRRGVRGAAG